MLKTPLVELKRLTLDGTELSLLPVERKNNRGQRTDHYYLAKLPPVTVGQATATATLRRVIDGSESVKEFRLDIRPDSAKSQGM